MSDDALAFPRLDPLGIDGFVIRFSDSLSDAANVAALGLRAALESDPMPGMLETSSALVSVYVRFDPAGVSHSEMRAALAALMGARDWMSATLPSGRTRWHVPVVIGGALAPQLREAASLAGLTETAARASLTAAPLRVLTLGFSPGQPYLGQLPADWDLPRQTALTAAVPQGALVLAVRQMCLFSNAMPTGWRHVAQSRFLPFRPDAQAPFALSPGDEVQLHAVPQAELECLEAPHGGARRQALT